jgi:ribA/ribD-fused uncharacterized protein
VISSFSGSYRFLSNFWPVQVEYDGLIFDSTENAYQAAKCKSKAERLHFQTVGPGLAKCLGQKVEMRSDWESVKLQVMEDLLWQKFNDPQYKKLLLETIEHELVEGNHWGDKFWGVCKGEGQNHLGKLLMKIRKKLYELSISL